jgi:ferric enterobactin receptor
MKHCFTLGLLLLAFAPSVRAQTTTPPRASLAGTGQLRGTVQDAATHKPVEYATVILLPAIGTTPVASTTCDEQERFELKKLPTGTFRLQVSFVGYAPRIENVPVISESTSLGSLTLAAAAQKLDEVTVGANGRWSRVSPTALFTMPSRTLRMPAARRPT